MKIIHSDINVGDGWISYGKVIDIKLTWSDQKYNLTEDMLGLAFGNGQFLIDIGWYETSFGGVFKINLLENQNWDTPLYSKATEDLVKLDYYLIECIEIVKMKTNNFLCYSPIDDKLKLRE
jgi:hypothetical protein